MGCLVVPVLAGVAVDMCKARRFARLAEETQVNAGDLLCLAKAEHLALAGNAKVN